MADASPPAPRILSLDLLRGLDVLLMLFVNEVAGVRDAPAFLLHVPPEADGMTVTDVVFPAFLFIVGLSIPFGLGGRLERGEAPRVVWRHVLTRTFALLAVGVLMVNAERAAPGGPLPPPVWNMLMTAAVVLVWSAPAGEAAARRRRIRRAVGIGLLLLLALAYRGTDVAGLVQIRPHWWGILGLIGWAYLLAAGLYLLAGPRPAVFTGAMALLYCLYLADRVGEAPWLVALRPFLSIGSVLGSHGAVVVAGVVLGLMVRRAAREGTPPRALAGRALGYAASLAAAAVLLHAAHGLHPGFRYAKSMATPPWCLLSSAWTAAAWAAVYWVADARGFRRWPSVVGMAGENALVAYLMAPFFLSAFAASAPLLGANVYESLASPTAVGLVRSAVFAWLVVLFCGLLRRRGLRMQL